MRRIWAGVVAVCVFASAAFAEDLTADEKKWLKQCVEGLKSPSDRVMAGAEDAIMRLGPDALPSLVPLLGTLDPADDFDWAALGRALAGVGSSASADAIEAAQAKWPKPSQGRLTTLVADLRASKLGPRKPATPTAGGAAAAPPGAAAPDDPAVAAQVNAILDDYQGRNQVGSADAQVRKLIALGHAAVPHILRWLVAARRHGMGSNAAAYGLEALVTEADIPAVAAALGDGALTAASCLGKFRTPDARDALLDVVRRGFMSCDVLEGLEPHGSDPAARRALVEWLQGHGKEMSWDVGAVAQFLGERNVTDALPALRALTKLAGTALPRVASAMASLGDKEGIGLLIEFFETAMGSHSGYERNEAGRTLNRIVGQAWYVGTYEPDSPGDGYQGNFAEAAAKFREWWTANAEKLEFDASARHWRVK